LVVNVAINAVKLPKDSRRMLSGVFAAIYNLLLCYTL